MLSQVRFNISPLSFSAQTIKVPDYKQSFGSLKPLQKDTVEFTGKFTKIAQAMGETRKSLKGIKPVKIAAKEKGITICTTAKKGLSTCGEEIQLGIKETGIMGSNTEIVRKPLILGAPKL